MEAFVNELFQNPNMGKDLGNGVRKIRMAVKKCVVSIDFQQNTTDFWRKFETQYSTSVKNIFYLCTVIAG